MLLSRRQGRIGAPSSGALSFVSQSFGGSALTMTDPYLPSGTTHAIFHDGDFIGNSTWDEGGREVWGVDLATFTPIDGNGGTFSYVHGNGARGGYAVCANSTHIFSTASLQTNKTLYDEFQPPEYPYYYFPHYVEYSPNVFDTWRWEGLFRKSRSTYLLAPFTGGKGLGSPGAAFKMLTEHQEWDHNVVLGVDATKKGIACTETEVYVSDPYYSKIWVIDANSMAVIRQVAASNTIGHLAVAADGNLWAVVGSTIQKLDITGATAVTLTTVTPTNPAGKIGVLPDGRLWHSDTVDNKIRIRGTNGGAVQATFGNNLWATGDISSSQPNLGPTIGFHYDGTHYYVAFEFIPNAYGTMVCKYDASGVEVNRLFSTQFIETADIDLDTNKLYSRYHRFGFDRSANPQATLEAITYDPNNAAADYRGSLFTVSSYIRNVLGRKFIYEFTQFGTRMTIREIVAGVNRQRPAGHMESNQVIGGVPYSSYIWVPPDNGTLAPDTDDYSYESSLNPTNYGDWYFQWVDKQGTLWRLVAKQPYDGRTNVVQKLPCTTLDANNNPVYSWAAMQEEAVSALLGAGAIVMRFYYDFATDTGILTGYSDAYPITPAGNFWSYGAGRIWKCYGNWTGRLGARYHRWTMYPTIADNDVIRSADLDRNLLVLGHMAAAKCSAYRLDTGQFIRDLASTGATGVDTYWNDTAHSVRVRCLDAAGTEYRVIKERGISGAAVIFNVTLTP